jgi:pyridoxine 5-phosphate synthase
MIALGVNIDHVATLRQARYREMPDSPNAEPCPVAAALAAEEAGAHGITAHLRADRRHMQDEDIHALRRSVRTKLNLEMGLHPDILSLALELQPQDVCLVPEEREEVTTEGGLDAVRHREDLLRVVPELQSAGIRVSLFIDPETPMLEIAAKVGAEFVELHTGAYANAHEEKEMETEWQRLVAAAKKAHQLGLRVNAGHGLNYENVLRFRQLPHLEELNIGHSIISHSITVGLPQAVREMLMLLGDEG